jgi:hypothetical protein
VNARDLPASIRLRTSYNKQSCNCASQQILPLRAVASTPSSSHASAPSGVYYLYGGPIPSTTLTSSTGFSGPSSSTGIPGAYVLPSASAAFILSDVPSS